MGLAAPALAYLKIHPDNPHYFQETATGKAVMITGYGSILPVSEEFISIDANINELKNNKIMYARVWHFLPWGLTKAVWPWDRSSVPGATMGGNKIDMEKWNPVYWNRMHDSLTKADKAGIYAEIHLFDRCGMSPPEKGRWFSNPWASDNNINNLETPTADKDGTPEFYLYTEKPNLRNQQERYVRKMIDETIKYPNIIYEIENEHWAYNNSKFVAYYAKFVKDYIAEKYPKSPRLVSYSSLEKDLEDCYTIPYVDIVNSHLGDLAKLNGYIESRWGKNKAINIDEFANNETDTNNLRALCWTIITSGGNFHIEDPNSTAKPYDVVENIRLFKINSGWDFIHAAPNKGLVTSGDGCCMAQPGKEYVIYFPTGGRKKVDLAPAKKYHARWWNPVSGRFVKPAVFSHAGGVKVLVTPDPSDWVLQITSQCVK